MSAATQRSSGPSAGARRTGWKAYAIAAGACGLMTAGAWFFGVDPAMAKRDAAAADFAELDDRQHKAKGLADNLATARRQLADTNRQVDALPLRLEPAAAVNARLSRLAHAAWETGLGVDEIQPGPAADGPFYQTVPIRVSGTGTYPTCAAFLHQLRMQFPDTAVRSFDCINPSPARDKPMATYRLELVWYTAPVRK